MNQGTYPLAASMINQLNRLDQISNNLANINTNGFKQEGLTETTFNQYLKKAENEGIVPSKINTITNNIPKLDSKYISSEMGPIISTGNTLDFSLTQGDNFFKLQDSNGDILYTRDGSFKNVDNFLVDSNGNNILNADNEPIVVEGNFASQIGVVQIPYTNLEKVGNNNFKIKDVAQSQVFENNDNLIMQGTIETSNVNSVTAMVALIDAHRRFDQSQKAIKSIDELNAGLIEKIGNNTK